MHIIEGVKISGLASRYPSNIERTDDYVHFSAEEASKFKSNVGISERRVVDAGICASDLCETAANDLLSGLGWEPENVDILVMITQTSDYPVPGNAVLLQSRLRIKNSAICFDINLGCSSFPYGVFVISSMMKAAGLKRGILCFGDVSSKVCSINDKSAYPLFGDAGSAVAFECSDNSVMAFDLMTDGSGYKAIIIESGGLASRNPVNIESFVEKDVAPGIRRNSLNLVLNGADIFSFAIGKVPASINRLLKYCNVGINEYDYLVLHQANKMINDQIVRKLKADPERSLSSLEFYGNTSSVSIPFTITANSNRLQSQSNKIIASGFGVGLSWGTISFDLGANVFYSHKEL